MPKESTTARREVRPERPRRQPSGPPPREPKRAPDWVGVSRGVAVFLGLVGLVSVLAAYRSPAPSSDFWWVDLRPLAPEAARGFVAVVSVLLLLFGAFNPLPGILRVGGLFGTILLTSGAAWHVVMRGLPTGGGARSWIPFEIYLGGLLAVVLAGMIRQPAPAAHRSRSFTLGLAAFVLCALGLPLAQMFCGRSPEPGGTSDAVVVLGCRLDADGRPSRALERRIEQGVQLFRDNDAQALVLSVETSPGAAGDTQPIIDLAIRYGVPQPAVIVDPRADSTHAAIAHAIELLEPGGMKSAVAISRGIHLPRVRLGFLQRGWSVRTMPLIEPDPQELDWAGIGGEIAAQWADFLRTLVDAAQQSSGTRKSNGGDQGASPAPDDDKPIDRLFPPDP